MADELKLTVALGLTLSDGTELDVAVNDLLRDVAGTNILHNKQDIGTSEEAIVLGDAGVGGYFLGINRDSTNYITIRPGTGATDLIQLLAGDVCLFRMDAQAPFAIADTAGCILEYWLIEV